MSEKVNEVNGGEDFEGLYKFCSIVYLHMNYIVRNINQQGPSMLTG